MITQRWFSPRRFQSAFAGIVFIVPVLAFSPAAFGAGWSQPAVIAASVPSTAPNAFAFNPTGNELCVIAQGVSGGGAVVQVAQRSFGGPWSALSTIGTIHSVGQVTVQDLSVSYSASNNAAAVWSVGGGVQIALRSSSGAWQSPVSFVPTGGASRLRAKLDAQGNGVAVWARATSTGSVVEAVTWSASGAFGPVVPLSPSSEGGFLPDVAVNEVGTAVAVWQVAGPQDAANPFEVESATRAAGGSWSAAIAASPNVPQTWSPQVAVDGSGNATVVWEQGATTNNERIYAATQHAGGAWSSPVRIEPNDWYMAGQDSVGADSAGDVTASWVVEDATGVMQVHAATLPAGGTWGAPASLGRLAANGSTTNLMPPVAVARDGSIAVVGWAPYGGAGSPNAAVRLGLGQWVSTAISGEGQLSKVMATNNSRGSVVWPARNGVKYHVALWQSDFQ